MEEDVIVVVVVAVMGPNFLVGKEPHFLTSSVVVVQIG